MVIVIVLVLLLFLLRLCLVFAVNEVCQRVGDVRDGFVVVLVGVTAWRVEICCCCF